MQLMREVFFRLHLRGRRHTFASPALAYVLPHFDALTHVVILAIVSSAFIFQRFVEVCHSVFVKRSSFKRSSKKFAESS